MANTIRKQNTPRKRQQKTRSAPQVSTTPQKLERQISFYCTQELFNQIHIEKVRRGLAIQEMVTKALAEYFSRPPVDELRAQERAFVEKLTREGRAPAIEDPHYEGQRWIDLAWRYFQRMPRAKRLILEEFIVLDLKHYGSSRIKTKD